MEKYEIIPKEKIERIELYINSKKKTLEQIVQETGCDYAINGGLFNADWTACNHLRANGKQYATDKYTYYGLAWNNADNHLSMAHSRDEENYNNYLAFCEIIYKGAAVTKPTYPAAVGGARQRTVAGYTKDGDTLLYVSTDGKTPEQLRDRITCLGNIEFCLMLDGGGSTQGYFNGEYIKSSRVVHNLLLVYLKAEATIQPEITAERIVALAASQVGIAETATNKVKYNTEYYGSAVSGSAFSWCCVFIWWLFHTLDADNLYYNGEKTASCTTLYNWAKSAGLAIYGNYQPGDIVFFDWDKSGDCDHVGIVESVSGNTVYTIEGNQNDAVTRVSRSVGDISAAYRPAYKVTASELTAEFAALAEEFDRFALAFAKFSEKIKKSSV